jgi:hypothetical protein
VFRTDGSRPATFVEITTGRRLDGQLLWRRLDEGSVVTATVGEHLLGGAPFDDFEDALAGLRSELEAVGLMMACNRFRCDAFVSSLARQMSSGLGCYLVRKKHPVDPDDLVASLDETDLDAIATIEESTAHIEAWIESCQPRGLRWRR